MSFISKVTKYTILGILILGIVFYILFSVIYHSGIPQKAIKDFTEQELSKTFRREITIGSVHGNLLTQAILMDVKIADKKQISDGVLLEIKELTVNYNVIKAFLFKKGDLLSTAKIATLDNVHLKLIRNTNDHWNLIDFLFPPPDPNNPPQPPTFTGILYFNEVHGSFTDMKGWAKEPISEPFTEEFERIIGSINFRDLHHSSLNLTGKLKQSRGLININGIFDAIKARYQFNINVEKLAAPKWGPYILTLKDYAISGDPFRLTGTLTSKEHPVRGQIPFFYDLDLHMNNTTFAMPFLSLPAEHIKGVININNQNDELQFLKCTGYVNDVHFVGNGSLQLKDGKIDLDVRSTTPFDIKQLKSIFGFIKTWDISGKGEAKFSVKGKLGNPYLNGTLQIKKAKIYSQTAPYLQLSYQLHKNILDIQLTQGLFHEGSISGKGTVSFASKDPYLKLVMNGSHLSLKSVLPSLKKHVRGHINVVALLEGPSRQYKVQSHLTGINANAFNQAVTSLTVPFTVRDYTNTNFNGTRVYLNNNENPLKLGGRIQNVSDVLLYIGGKDIPFNGLDDPDEGKGQLSVTSTLKAHLSKSFYQKPFSHLNGKFHAHITDYPLYGKRYEYLDLNLSFEEQDIVLHQFKLQREEENVIAVGRFQNFKPKNLFLKSHRFDISKVSLLQKHVPPGFKPVAGKLDSYLNISHIPKTSLSPGLKPLGNYQMRGTITLNNALLKGQSIDSLHFRGDWDGSQLILHQLLMTNNHSRFSIQGDLTPMKNVNLIINKPTMIHFKDFSSFLHPVKNLSGSLQLKGSVKGPWESPVFSIVFLMAHLKTNYLDIEEVNGNIVYRDGIYNLQPLHIAHKNDIFDVIGQINAQSYFTQETFKLGQLGYDLNINIEQAHLQNVSVFLEGLNQELQAKKKLSALIHPDFIDNKTHYPAIYDPHASSGNIFLPGEDSDSFQYFSVVHKNHSEREKMEALKLSHLMKGSITGTVYAKSLPDFLPEFSADIYIENFAFHKLKADELVLSTQTNENIIETDITLENGYVSQKPFNKIQSITRYDDGILWLDKLSLETDKSNNSNLISGYIPLSSIWTKNNEEEMDVSFHFEGDDIGILSALSPFITNITGSDTIDFTVKGPLDHPVLNAGKVHLKDTVITFSGDSIFKSPIKIQDHTISIVNNNLVFKKLPLIWQGPETTLSSSEPNENKLVLSGRVGLKYLNFINPDTLDLDLDMTIEDTILTLKYPNIYSGRLNLKSNSIKGLYSIPLNKGTRQKIEKNIGTPEESGPLITSEVSLQDGQIKLPELGSKKSLPAFLLDLSLHIKRDVT
ncbi:MAG: hypothetical protein HRT90_07195, partial [Candidatus Margulisbacteria bacterium]|nr:hypothetical protein [Candidatus Margulisiibacteriota bacterium]